MERPALRLAHRPVLALPLPLGALLGAASAIGPTNGATAYTQNLYRAGDFVGQTNGVQSVGTSMQMMINMIEPTNNRTAARQLALQNVARAYSNLLSPRPGR